MDFSTILQHGRENVSRTEPEGDDITQKPGGFLHSDPKRQADAVSGESGRILVKQIRPDRHRCTAGRPCQMTAPVIQAANAQIRFGRRVLTTEHCFARRLLRQVQKFAHCRRVPCAGNIRVAVFARIAKRRGTSLILIEILQVVYPHVRRRSDFGADGFAGKLPFRAEVISQTLG
ncbi:hypothetical protein SDC9_178510 [bioreactor metagenome]|uniref:Uncharacterized protein n=1 Tax=bioreactor metagenome TaxID=1076179 RepID=A0A645GZ75_9ZZZZ